MLIISGHFLLKTSNRCGGKQAYVKLICTAIFAFFCATSQASETDSASTQIEQNKPIISNNMPDELFVMPDYTTERATFLRLEKRLWNMDEQTFSNAIKSLGDYPLVPYLVEKQLSYKLRLSDEGQVRAFLNEYEGTPLAKNLRRKWLEYLAKRNKVALFIEFYKPTRNAKLACTFIDYQIRQGTSLPAMFDQIARLWTVGKSQPKQCDGIFKKWINAGELTEDLILLRIKKAADGGKHTLIPYLRSLLPENKRYLADLWHKTRRNPSYVKNLSAFQGKYPQIEADILTYGLSRLIWRDPSLATKTMEKARKRTTFTNAQQAKVYGKFGIKLAIDDDESAEEYLVKAAQFGDDTDVMRWHLAYLLRQQDWSRLVLLLETADPQDVKGNEYSYWLARAYEYLGRQDEANTLYQQLASQRSYYGFLSSAQLDQAFSLKDTPIEVFPEDITTVLAFESSKRAYELRQLGRFHEARLEWRRTQDLVSEQKKLVTAVIANKWQWHDQAIFTLAREGYLDDVQKRFPVAYQDVIVREANKNKIEPEWAFAIARRESSFMSDAVSSANARGLMQVLPSTAKYLEKKKVSNRQLFDVETNAKLGNKYLRYLMNKVGDNKILATASYNAGWRKVKQWLPENQALAADIWVELIPYRETRNYVKAILAYQQIYKIRLDAVNESLIGQHKEGIENNASQGQQLAQKQARQNVFIEFIATEIPTSI